MNFAPILHKTLVSGLTKKEVMWKIRSKTQIVNSQYITDNPSFNGRISEDQFRVSSVIRASQNALPLVIGTVENTSRGSIIWLTFKLFPAGKLYLRFSSLLCLLIGLVFLLMARYHVASVICLLVALLNYTVLTINFQRKAHSILDELNDILVEHQE